MKYGNSEIRFVSKHSKYPLYYQFNYLLIRLNSFINCRHVLLVLMNLILYQCRIRKSGTWWLENQFVNDLKAFIKINLKRY